MTPAPTRTKREKSEREIELELELATTRAIYRRLDALPPGMAHRIAANMVGRFPATETNGSVN